MSTRMKCTASGCKEASVGRRLCRKHYQAAWKAGELEQHKTAPTRKRNRVVCPPEHKHASSSTCYILHQCRCDPCTDHHTLMERNRSRLKAYGRFDRGLVDAGPVREHMMMLAEFGIGYKRVAMLAGIGTTAARTLIWGRQEPGPRNGELQKQVARRTAEAILSVQPSLDLLGGGVPVPAGPYVRRLQALVALGWSQSKLADRLGVTRANFDWLRRYEVLGSHRNRLRISAKHARAVVALYEELSMRLPPRGNQRDRIAYSRAVRFGRERGWPLPMDWEAIDNDFDRHIRRSAA